MSSFNVTPLGVFNSGWTGSGTLSNYTTNDGDTTYINNTAASGSRATYTLPNVTSGQVPDGAVITNIYPTAVIRGNGSTGQLFEFTMYNVGNATFYDSGTIATSSTSYTAQYSGFATSPRDGTPWTVSLIRAWQNNADTNLRWVAGIVSRNSTADAIRVTQMYLTIDYYVVHDIGVSGTGGPFASGTANIGLIRSEAASGGCQLSGVANVGLTRAFTASGGSLLSGEATPSVTRTITATGGAVLGGVATPTYRQSITATGGSQLSGTAIVSVTRTITATGGAVLGGAAALQTGNDYIGTGGSQLGGSAIVTVVCNLTATGSALLGGAAAVDVTRYVLMTGTGASSLSGTADLSRIRNMVATSSQSLGGAALLNMTWALNGTGLEVLSGSAGTLLNIVPLSGTGACSLTGSAAMVSSYGMQATCLNNLTGSANLAATWNLTGSAASSLVGIAIYRQLRSITGTGASNLTGSAAIGLTKNLAATSASSLGGSASLSVDRSMSATCSLSCNPVASLTVFKSLTGTGACSLAGSAAISNRKQMTATSLQSLSGSAAMIRTQGMHATCSNSLAGSANLTRITPLSATGTSSLSGSARLNTSLHATGTSSLSGSARLTVNYSLSGTGSQSLSGAATYRQFRSISGTGACSLTGSADLTRTRGISATSASSLSGSAAMSVNRSMSATGNMELNGAARLYEHLSQSLYSYLKNDVTLYNTRAPQNPSFPYVVFTFDETTHSQYLSSSAGQAESTIEFDIIAKTYAETKEIENILLNKLGGFAGFMELTNVIDVRMSGNSSTVLNTKTEKLHRKNMVFEFAYTEWIPLCQFDITTTTEEFEEELVSYLFPLTIYQGQLPQNYDTSTTAVVMRQVDGRTTDYTTGYLNTDKTYEFIVHAPRVVDAIAARNLLRNKLDGLTGSIGEANVLECSLDSEGQSYEISFAQKPLAAIDCRYEFAITPA
jgi:hypothetical protein